jgi:hypothetical protein
MSNSAMTSFPYIDLILSFEPKAICISCLLPVIFGRLRNEDGNMETYATEDIVGFIDHVVSALELLETCRDYSEMTKVKRVREV